MLILSNARLYTGTHIYQNHSIVIDHDKIIMIEDNEKLESHSSMTSHAQLIDLKGLNINAGFIDLQLNGCGGVNLNQANSADTLIQMHKTNLNSGCTSFLPTLITCSDEEMRDAIKLTSTYMQSPQTHLLGLHLEGPYISPNKKGIHPEHFIRRPSDEMIHLICSHPEVVKMVTLAPEQVDSNYIDLLYKAGIKISAGHTNATFEEAKQGFNNGIQAVTHLYNAMSSITGREPGVIGAIFDHFTNGGIKNSPLHVGVIADGFHVHYDNIRLAKQLMQESLYLVTDAVAPAGTTIDHYEFAGKTLFHKDGKCFDENGTLGGSALTMNQAILNCIRHVDITIEEALRMASLYPAQLLNIDNKLGRIDIGHHANLTIFDDTLDIKANVVDGEYIAISI